MMTTDDTHWTEWSLPVGDDLPRDTLQVQLEVYGETALLRGFEADRNWVRTVSADEIANVFIRHLGFSSGLLPDNALWWNQGETGQMVALWRPPQVWPVALQREAFQPPARLRLPMPGLVFVCSPARRPGSTPPWNGPATPSSSSTAPRVSTSSGTAGSAPAATVFRRRWGGYPNPSSSPSSPLPETARAGRKSTPTTCKPYGRNLMERLTTRLRTWFPNAPWATSSRPPKADGAATTNPGVAPVGYVVNHPAGLAGSQGIGYDYVLGAGGLYVQSESAHLTARLLVAPAEVRGLAPVSEKVELANGPIPVHVFELGLAWLLAAPGTERFFAIRCEGDAYRLVVPPQEGTGSSLTYQPPQGVIAEFHSHGPHSAFFSATDDRDEQGFRVYGVV